MLQPALYTPTGGVPFQSALQNDPEFRSSALHGVPLQKACRADAVDRKPAQNTIQNPTGEAKIFKTVDRRLK